jgi:hypothetical protein
MNTTRAKVSSEKGVLYAATETAETNKIKKSANSCRCPHYLRVPEGAHPRCNPCPDLENTVAAGKYTIRQEHRVGSDLRTWSSCPDSKGIAQGIRVSECGASGGTHGRLASCGSSPGEVIPISNQGAIFVGSSSAPQRTVVYASSPHSSPPRYHP